MRRICRLALCALAAALLLAVPVFADMGPKPQLIVRVENGPEELYYLELLAEGDASRYPEGTVGGLSEEERSALDQGLLAALTAAVPEGWYGCLTQGRLVWGNIDSEDGVFQFGYLGVPDVCRVLMVTKSGETFLSEPFDRRVLQSSVTMDWPAKTLRLPPLPLAYAAQFLATFLPTLAIEGILLLLFRLWSRRNGRVFLLTNLVTQGGLTLWLSLRTVRGGVFMNLRNWLSEVFWLLEYLPANVGEDGLSRGLLNLVYGFRFGPPRGLLQAELVIFLVEMGLYMWLFRECSRKRAALYGFTANLCSFLLGFYLMEPVWRFVVRNIL